MKTFAFETTNTTFGRIRLFYILFEHNKKFVEEKLNV